MKSLLGRIGVILVLLWLTTMSAVAQTSSGSISGTVTDPNGAVIPDAKVLVKNDQTGIAFNSAATGAGLYVLPAVPVGMYTITVEHTGFKKMVRSNVEVRIGARVTVNLQLEVGDVQQSVEVKAEAPLLETTTPERGTNLLPQFMDKLPLYSSGIRNAESFVGYMPGVNSGASETSISGSGGRAKEILIDGGSTVSPESGGMAMQNIGAEAYTEFKLTTGSYSAELGRFGGGVEMFNTKSGANQVHGSGFWNLRRDIFNAAGWTSNSKLNQTPGFRNKERYNEAGGSIGGPVYIPKVYDGRNKTFFHFTYSRDLRPASFGFANLTVPTALQKQGIFTEAGVATIYDPATTTTVNGVNVRTPFAGNVVPKNRWSKVSTNLMQYIPETTGPGITSNYTHANTSTFTNDIWTIKLDHSVTNDHRVAFFLSNYTDTTDAVTSFDGYLGQGLTSYNKPVTLRLNHDWIIRPTLLLHSMLSYSSTRSTWANPNQRGFASKVGLPTQGGDSDATPIVYMTGALGYSTWGMDQGKVDNGGQWNYTYHMTQGLTWVRGKHQIKIGWDVRRLQTKGSDKAGTNGSYSFSSYQTADPAKLSNTGNAFASLLLGYPNSASQAALPISDSNIRYGYHAGYIQDNWRVAPRLTLELGLRYEVPKGFHYVNGNYSTLDLTLPNPGAGGLPGALVFGGTGGGRTGKMYLYSTDYTNIGPRLGFAYQIASKTVFRGGWGIYYQTLGNGGCGCTSGFNYSASASSDGVNPFFNWDTSIPYPPGYQPPPQLSSTYLNGTSGTVIGETYGRAPRVYTWSASLQHEVKGFLLEAAYVANRGRGLNSTVEMNQLPTSLLSLGPLLTKRITDPAVVALGYKEPFTGFANLFGSSATLAQSLRPYPQFKALSLLNANVGATWYDSLQMKVERRTGSLTLMGNYTFSKSLSNMHLRQIFGQGSYGAQDAYNTSEMKSYLPMDQTHVASILSVYDLPFGKGKKFLGSTNKVVNAIVSGWSLAGTQKYQSGNLIRLTSPTNTLGSTLFSQTQKANLTGKPIKTGLGRTDLDPNDPSKLWFNYGVKGVDSPFAAPAQYALGTAAVYQSAFRQPAGLTENLSIMKTFTLFERFNFRYRADAYNVFNRHNFGGINGTVGNANFGRATAAAGPRIITMGLRLDF